MPFADCGKHRKPGGNGNNQYTVTTEEPVQEELCQNDTIPPTATENSVRKQIAEQHNVSESYVARSEKFMRCLLYTSDAADE